MDGSPSPAADLVFDPVRHRYWFKGRELLSVTTILRMTGMINADHFTEESRVRGSLVHKSCELINRGQFDQALAIDQHYMGYVNAYLTFLDEDEAVVLGEPEFQVCDPVYGYAGTVDVRLWLPRRIYQGVVGWRGTVDFKTGSPADWHRLQLSAYARRTGDANRACLYLREDGTYLFKPFEKSAADDAAFLGAAALANWKGRI